MTIEKRLLTIRLLNEMVLTPKCSDKLQLKDASHKIATEKNCNVTKK